MQPELRTLDRFSPSDLGYGAGYAKYTQEDLLGEKLKGRKYYTPSNGPEFLR